MTASGIPVSSRCRHDPDPGADGDTFRGTGAPEIDTQQGPAALTEIIGGYDGALMSDDAKLTTVASIASLSRAIVIDRTVRSLLAKMELTMKKLRMVCLVASLMLPALPALATVTITAQVLGENPTLEQVEAEFMRIGYANVTGLKGWGHYFTANASYGGQRVLAMMNTTTGEVDYWQLRKQPYPD